MLKARRIVVTVMVTLLLWTALPRGILDSAEQEPLPRSRCGSQELETEWLAALREVVKLTKEAYRNGMGSFDEVLQATHAVVEAELEQSRLNRSVLVLQQIVAEAREQELKAIQFSEAGQATFRMALKSRADRLHAEIMLAQAREDLSKQTEEKVRPNKSDQVAQAEMQVAIKRAIVKVAEAKRNAYTAKLATIKARASEAAALESLADKQLKRYEDLGNQKAVDDRIVDEARVRWESAKAHRATAEGEIAENEANVAVEQARVELAKQQLEMANLQLRQLKASR